ncbi:MAG TPA: MerR family transcriptional regulator [Anaerolineales bacterium]|nr:MerR family transcriptional regulator [Anaerolineales bacterium]
MSYTVKQLSDLAGVSIRTLHYYDEIGLLGPDSVGANGYRYYGDGSVLRLQQILFYRELGLELSQIKDIVARADFDVQSALESHRKSLQGRVERLNRLIATVDDTILHLKGKKAMSKKQLFEAFSDEEQAKYAAEAEQMYDPATVRASQKKWKSYTPADKQRIADEGNAAYEAIVAAIPLGPGSPQAQAGVERWRKHMDYFWTPNLEQLVGLTELYNSDPRFKANFDRIDPRLAEFMREAVKIYVGKK